MRQLSDEIFLVSIASGHGADQCHSVNVGGVEGPAAGTRTVWEQRMVVVRSQPIAGGPVDDAWVSYQLSACYQGSRIQPDAD